MNPNNPESYPWKRCRTYSDCSDYLRNGEIKFLVSFGIEARILLSEREDCGMYKHLIQKQAKQGYIT